MQTSAVQALKAPSEDALADRVFQHLRHQEESVPLLTIAIDLGISIQEAEEAIDVLRGEPSIEPGSEPGTWRIPTTWQRRVARQ